MLPIFHKHTPGLWPVLIVGLACLVFLPSLNNGLVGWDDRIITDSPSVRDLSVGSIFRMFLLPDDISSSYQPIRGLALSTVYAFWGDSPTGYILLGLLLYLANVYLFYRLAVLLSPVGGRSTLLAAVVASLLFALHPVHVEVVSWHQGFKMPLMGLFFLLVLICYIRFRSGEGERYYWFCLTAFIASLLSQPAAISLPFILLAYEVLWQPGTNSDRGIISRKIITLRLFPFFLPAVVLAFHLLFLSSVRLGAGLSGDAPLIARLTFVPVVWGKSLLKLVFPVNISARYPLDIPIDPNWLGTLGWLTVCFVVGFAILRSSEKRSVGSFLIAFFVMAILPTSGLIETSTLLADRYLYIPGMAVCLAAGIGLSRFFGSKAAASRWKLILTGLLLMSMTAITLSRQQDWQDRVSLWSRVVDVYPQHSLGRFNLADAWNAEGNSAKAIEHYLAALEIDPNYGDAYANLSTLMLNQGRSGLARQLIERAAALRSDRAEVWIKHGIIAASSGDDSTAEDSFIRAVELGQGWAWAGHFNLSMLYASRGDTTLALESLKSADQAAKESGRPEEVIRNIKRAIVSLSAGADR